MHLPPQTITVPLQWKWDLVPPGTVFPLIGHKPYPGKVAIVIEDGVTYYVYAPSDPPTDGPCAAVEGRCSRAIGGLKALVGSSFPVINRFQDGGEKVSLGYVLDAPLPTTNDTVKKALKSMKVDETRCECGASTSKTTHASWCPCKLEVIR